MFRALGLAFKNKGFLVQVFFNAQKGRIWNREKYVQHASG